MKLCIEVSFRFGDIVYLKTDQDQKPRMVISYLVDKSNEVLYKLQQGTYSDYHYEMEITSEKDIILTTTN